MLSTLEKLNIDDLSKILNPSNDAFLKLVKVAPSLYHEVTLQKNYKTRIIEIPNPTLKKVQKLLLEKILYYLHTHPRLYGYPGSSIKKAVSGHVRKPIVITMDIKDFFPSVKSSQVKKMFRRRKASKEVARVLTRLTTYKNHLPHGSPTSPCIGRLILNPLALNLEKMLNRIHPNAIFSIYVDDITISGPDGLKKSIPTIYKMIERFGFEVNKNKTKIMDQQKEQISLNIRLNKRIEPTTKFLKEVENLEEKLPSSHPTIIGKKAWIKFLFRDEN